MTFPRLPRLGYSLLAQTYSQFATLLIQFSTIPLLIHFWGVERYGVWLALTALPTYLSLSDFGFTFTAKNEMAMQVARGDREGALITYQSVFAALSVGLTCLAAITSITIIATPLAHLIKLSDVTVRTAQLVLLTQMVGMLLYQFLLLSCSAIRCAGRPATETTLVTSGRLIETLAVLVSAAVSSNLVVASFAALLIRVGTLLVAQLIAHRTASWLKLGFKYARRDRLVRLLGPSLSYMLVPLANALLIQGPIVFISATMGPAAVALFSTCRTVTRLGMSGANMLTYAFTPEYSYVYGRGDDGTLRRVTRLHYSLFTIGAIAYVVAMAFFGRISISALSHHNIDPPTILVATLSGAVLIEMAWTTLFTPIAAKNRHQRLAILFAAISLVALASAAMLQASLAGLAGGLLAVHAAALIAVLVEIAVVDLKQRNKGQLHNARGSYAR